MMWPLIATAWPYAATTTVRVITKRRGEWEFRAPFSNNNERGQHFEPTCPFGHGISNPTPYCPSLSRVQARRPPRLSGFVLEILISLLIPPVRKDTWLGIRAQTYSNDG